jgi:hypothetical protein
MDRIRILGWIDHYERKFPGEVTVFPKWIGAMDDVEKAVAAGLVNLTGISPRPRGGYSYAIYGLTREGVRMLAGALLPAELCRNG